MSLFSDIIAGLQAAESAISALEALGTGATKEAKVNAVASIVIPLLPTVAATPVAEVIAAGEMIVGVVQALQSKAAPLVAPPA